MANNYTINIVPDDALQRNLPLFNLKVKSSGWAFKDYTWSCPAGLMGNDSGVGEFIETPNLSILFLQKKEFSRWDDDGENPIYGILYGLSPNFTHNSSGWGLMDYSGHRLKGRLKGKENYIDILEQILKTEKKSKAKTNWRLINSY